MRQFTKLRRGWLSGFLALVLALPAFAAHSSCVSELALQVLGSGGPTLDSRRAGSSYILWIDGRARVLLDAGGGSYARFGAAKGRIEDLQLIAISHFHVDHVVDLPAYIKGGYFTKRETPLPIAGPSASGEFPGAGEFMRRLFDSRRGAFAYLSGTLDGSEGHFETPVLEVAAEGAQESVVLDASDLKVLARAVPHGSVPTVAYRIETRGRIIVYGADQNGDDDGFAEYARDADLLVMPMAIGENSEGPAARLHATPAEIGTIARKSGARQLLLSHIMPRSEQHLDSVQEIVQRAYQKPAVAAEDLLCVELGE